MSAAHVSVALITYLSSVVMVQTIAQRMLSTKQPYSSSLEIVRGGGLVVCVCVCVWGGGGGCVCVCGGGGWLCVRGGGVGCL